MILRGRGVSFWTLKLDKLDEIFTNIENILTHWSVAQAGSKILLDINIHEK